MDKRRLGYVVILSVSAAVFQGTPPTLAQTAATPFDGNWSNQSVRCTPAMNWRAPGMEVSNGRFTRSGQMAHQYFTCDVSINPDGSFEKACGNGTSIAGRVVNNQMKYELKHPYAICAVAFERVLGAVQPVPAASAVNTETVTICSQTVDNSLRHQREALPSEQQDLWGIWDGEVLFHAQFRLCVGWLFDRINAKGELDAIYVYNTSGSGVLNNARMGTVTWKGGSYQNGTLVMKGPPASFELRKVSADTLQGSYIEAGNSYPVTFKRRKASN